MASRLRDFTGMNPLVYFLSKNNEAPQEFGDEFHQIFHAIAVNEEDKAELVAYKLNYLAQLWYKMWVNGRVEGEVPITWDILKIAFRESSFQHREAMVE